MKITELAKKAHPSNVEKYSKDGYKFKLNGDYWTLNKNITIDVYKIKDLICEGNHEGFLNTLAFYARERSAHTSKNIVERLFHMLKTIKEKEITSTGLINYRSTLKRETIWYLGALRPFFYKWNLLGYEGVSDEIVELLKSWKLKGSVKGEVVKTLDPRRGPLTDIELQGFNESVIQGFETGLLNIEQLCLALIVSSTGRRPIQISHLKIKDLFQAKNKKNEPIDILNTPRAKQRGQKFRGEFRQFAIQNELKVVINAQSDTARLHIKNLLKFDIPERLINELPLFPDLNSFKNASNPSDLEKLLKSDRLHVKSEWVTLLLKEIATKLQIKSERTGEKLNINTYRFRYTIGTRAAREGFGVMVIAELLDHTDNQNATVYVENIPEFTDRISKAVGEHLARHAQAFAGELIEDESMAKRSGDLSSRIRIEKDGLGNCGSYGFCGGKVPIPCYTCKQFQAWLHGPHELVLESLLSERNRVNKVTGDLNIASITDRTILAVIDVIERCKIKKRALGNG